MSSTTTTTTNDRIDTIGGSTVQHGPYNDRLYLMDLNPEDYPAIVDSIDKICGDKGYSKSFVIVPQELSEAFLDSDYVEEARVPGFFGGGSAGLFLGKFFSGERAERPEKALGQFRRVMSFHRRIHPGRLPRGFSFVRLRERNTKEMSKLYAEIFPDYPFPIDDPDFLARMMREKTLYFGIRRGERLAAVASAEINRRAGAAEMTDFVVLPEFRGRRLGIHLLRLLEQAALKRRLHTAYTIARLRSLGMNTVFLRSGYEFAGTLINNTRISTGIESMNVWYKRLNPS